MSCPEMGDARLKALIDTVHAERGKGLKEAIPLPPKLAIAGGHAAQAHLREEELSGDHSLVGFDFDLRIAEICRWGARGTLLSRDDPRSSSWSGLANKGRKEEEGH